MHSIEPSSSPPSLPGDQPWWRELNRYQWFVLLVSVLGWLFDTMDQQLFNIARPFAIQELRGGNVDMKFYGGLATMIFMFGWATGGIIFGILGDRIGRAKTMVITILLYSGFTGLSAASVGFWDFAMWRFLTGLGVGGEFAVGVALVAEVMPERARTPALGWLQACSAIGNITAAFIGLSLSGLEAAGALGEWQPWRYMFLVGALPALLAVLIRRHLKEPEKWVQAQASGDKQLGSFRDLLGTPIWRRHAIVGLVLASSGVIGLWGIGFFSFDLVRSVFRQTFETEMRADGQEKVDRDFITALAAQPNQLATVRESVKAPTYLLDPDARALYGAALALSDEGQTVSGPAMLTYLDRKGQSAEEQQRRAALLQAPAAPTEPLQPTADAILMRTRAFESRLTFWVSMNGVLFNTGAFFGIYLFARVTQYIGRRPTFAITFLLALFTTAFTFWNLTQFTDIFWMVPAMGFCQIALFGGYAIYFPELFPTHLRSTGISFCYNVGRYLAAFGPLLLGVLADRVFGHHGEVLSWRYAGVAMCSFFLVGLLALPFAPETKGKPLPE